MNIRHMFPQKHFDAHDLYDMLGDGITTVTIEKVDFKTKSSRDFGRPDADWFLFVEELKKPIKISPTSGFQLVDILKSDETDEWVGRRVGIGAVQIEVYDKRPWVVNFWATNDQPQLPHKTDLTGYARWTEAEKAKVLRRLPPGSGAGTTAAMAPTEKLGAQTAARLLVRLRERGLGWDNLTAYCKAMDRLDLIAGMMPADCPAELLQIAKVFYATSPIIAKCEDIDKAVAEVIAGWEPEPAAKGEVVDKTTGEVITPDDDIPF